MRAQVYRVLVAALFGLFGLAGSAAAAGPGCVDLLVDCDPLSSSLGTFCGRAPQSLSGEVASNISYVVFGAGVQSVSLTHCGSGATTVITSAANLCTLDGESLCPPDQCNDNICEIAITFNPAVAPALNGVGLSLLAGILLAIGIYGHRQRVY